MEVLRRQVEEVTDKLRQRARNATRWCREEEAVGLWEAVVLLEEALEGKQS